MGKEAQLVCVRSSFSKRFDIVSTRKLEQYVSDLEINISEGT